MTRPPRRRGPSRMPNPRGAARTGADLTAMEDLVVTRWHVDGQLPALRRRLHDVLVDYNRGAPGREVRTVPVAWLDRLHAQSSELTDWTTSVAHAIEMADGGTAIGTVLGYDASVRFTREEVADWDRGEAAARLVIDAANSGDEHAAEEALMAIARLDGRAFEAALYALGADDGLSDRLAASYVDQWAPWRLADGFVQTGYDVVHAIPDLIGLLRHPGDVLKLVDWIRKNPADFLAAGFDLEEFENDPVRWVGSFLPDLILFTVGAGAAKAGLRGLQASKAATIAARSAKLQAAGSAVKRLTMLKQWQAAAAAAATAAKVAKPLTQRLRALQEGAQRVQTPNDARVHDAQDEVVDQIGHRYRRQPEGSW